MHLMCRLRRHYPETKHQKQLRQQEERMDLLQDQLLKMQDRFDFFIMLQLKQGLVKLEYLGCRNELDEPTLDAKGNHELARAY